MCYVFMYIFLYLFSIDSAQFLKVVHFKHAELLQGVIWTLDNSFNLDKSHEVRTLSCLTLNFFFPKDNKFLFSTVKCLLLRIHCVIFVLIGLSFGTSL